MFTRRLFLQASGLSLLYGKAKKLIPNARKRTPPPPPAPTENGWGMPWQIPWGVGVTPSTNPVTEQGDPQSHTVFLPVIVKD